MWCDEYGEREGASELKWEYIVIAISHQTLSSFLQWSYSKPLLGEILLINKNLPASGFC